MGNCDITCYSLCFLWGAFYPFKNSAGAQSILDELFEEKMFLNSFLSPSLQRHSNKSQRQDCEKKIAATEKNSVLSVLDAFLLAWSGKQTR